MTTTKNTRYIGEYVCDDHNTEELNPDLLEWHERMFSTRAQAETWAYTNAMNDSCMDTWRSHRVEFKTSPYAHWARVPGTTWIDGVNEEQTQ